MDSPTAICVPVFSNPWWSGAERSGAVPPRRWGFRGLVRLRPRASRQVRPALPDLPPAAVALALRIWGHLLRGRL